MATRFPARLHAVLASQAPVGVIFRKGPARHVCSIRWNRATDQFQVGQWMCARIYERRADVSPDGRHMIYFAMNGRWSSKYRGSWTAISRVPWLKADLLFPKGDCWQGGGLFTSDTKYYLNGCHSDLVDAKAPGSAKLTLDEKFRPVGGQGGECTSIYYQRLLQHGWILKEQLSAGHTDRMSIFEKPLPHGWLLRKYAHAEVGAPVGKGCYWDEHELEHPARQQRILQPNWEWADVDNQTRNGETLVWAEGGCLFRAPVLAAGLGPVKTLFDFNPMQFERIVAPY